MSLFLEHPFLDSFDILDCPYLSQFFQLNNFGYVETVSKFIFKISMKENYWEISALSDSLLIPVFTPQMTIIITILKVISHSEVLVDVSRVSRAASGIN